MATEAGKESDILGAAGKSTVHRTETISDEDDNLNNHQELCVYNERSIDQHHIGLVEEHKSG